jgi:tannase/feruloyl esterase
MPQSRLRTLAWTGLAGLTAAGCASTPPSPTEPAAACTALMVTIPAFALGLPSGDARVQSARFVDASALNVPQAGPVVPALPRHCQVTGEIAPLDRAAPAIRFQVNLPVDWNGRAVQYGGGGFNGVLITGLDFPPAARADFPAPLAHGYVTYGTDSGHQSAPGVPLQAFALNDEALVNFAHAAYKKVKDVAVVLIRLRYGKAPEQVYFVGSSEGGREGLTMAQRYPRDFDGVFSTVPVINWTALQHANMRNGLAQMGERWIRPGQIKLVHDAVLAACDAADGVRDGIVSDYAGCHSRFDVTKLRCAAGRAGDACLSEAQVRAVQALHSPYAFQFSLAHGVRSYPAWGVGGEDMPGTFPAGGWRAWFTGDTAPVLPPASDNSRAWQFGSGAIQYFYARDGKYDLRKYDPNRFRERIAQVSELMDSMDPDLSAFLARGGRLIMLEHMADYAQSPYAGIEYWRSVVAKMGQAAVDQFARLYVAPGVDHAGTGAPANIDMLSVLADWVERGRAPGNLEAVAQDRVPPFAVTNSRPLCRWPAYPHYKGGAQYRAGSYECRAGKR